MVAVACSLQSQYDNVDWNTYLREAISNGKIIEAFEELEAEASAAANANRWDQASTFL